MKISESFVKEILIEEFSENFQYFYDKSKLIQYLDKKMKAVHGNSKTRRSLANIYAIYSLIYYYSSDFYENPEKYKGFNGYDYMKLFAFYRGLYGGNKLQNHALNSRVNGEFKNRFSEPTDDLIIINNGKYLLHINYLYIDGIDISRVVQKIIEKYIQLLTEKDHALIGVLEDLSKLEDYEDKRRQLSILLTEDSEARIFEIISFAILKNHYKNIKIFFGYTLETIVEEELTLFKTGRTNANDGGIDFVMRPVGRFFQVTEVNSYEKYLLDIDKVMHFPISFVIKTRATKDLVLSSLNAYIMERSGGMEVIQNRYFKSIEEIITINELESWIFELDNSDVDNILSDINVYYRLEMNLESEDFNEDS